MKTEQARALKIGDGIVLSNASKWDDMTVGKSYPVIKVVNGAVHITDDIGDTRSWRFNSSPHDFDLPEVSAPTNTQWVPFDKERMSEAEGYRLVRNLRAITEVVLISDTLAWRDDLGEFDCGRVTLELVEMLVPVVVKYPCICWASNTSGAHFVVAVLIYSEDETSEMYRYKAGNGNSYKHATPLTADELAEIGLKQIS